MKKVLCFIAAALFCASFTLANTPDEPLKTGKCSNAKKSGGAGKSVKSETHAKGTASASRPNYAQKKAKTSSDSQPNVGKKAFKKDFTGYGKGNAVKKASKKVKNLGSGCGTIKCQPKRVENNFHKKHHRGLKTRQGR